MPPERAPGLRAGNSAADLAAQLAEVWQDLASLGAGLDDAAWAAPTPCPGWPVHAQYAHVIGTESSILGRPNPDALGPAPVEGKPEHVRNQIGAFNEVWVAHLGSRPRPAVLDALAEVTGARNRALAAMTEADFDAPSWTPVGQADYRRFMQIRVFDCWVHDQDVRDAVGRPGFETGAVAEQSYDEMVRAAGFVIGKKAGAPTGARVRLSLTDPLERTVDVEVTDRARVVDALSGPPTATLTMSSTAYARLSCGRVAAPDVADGVRGGVTFGGDRQLGRRVLDALPFTI